MKRRLLCAALAAVPLFAIDVSAATFTYHGSLQDFGAPAEGNYDIELTLYSDAQGGSVVAGPLRLRGVAVHRGNFSVAADFGPLVQSFGQAYVDVKVGATGAAELVPVTGRTAVMSSASSVCPGAWTLQGNAGNPSGSYLGTADSQPLIFEVNATQVGNISESNPDQPTIVFGASSNVAAGVSATVSGGENNVLAGGYATIAGGQGNSVGLAEWAVVGGGHGNSVGASTATIGGGFSNQANGVNSTVSGGDNNAASGKNSIVGGGVDNSAVGGASTVPGGALNYAGGDLSFAAGGDAYVRDATQAGNSGTCSAGSTCGDYDTFVWNGGYPAKFVSSGPQQFIINAPGEVAINGTPAANVSGTLPNLGIFGNANSTGIADLALIPTGSSAGPSTTNGAPLGQFDLIAGSSAGATVGDFGILAAGGVVLELDSTGNFGITGAAFKPGGGSWSTPSDRRIKQEVAPIRDALDTVMKLRPVTFHYTPDYRTAHGNLPDRPYAGFIAQEFADVFPDAVVSTSEPVPGAAKGETPILALDSSPALITTIAAVQELAAHAQANDDDLASLKRENAELRRQLADVLTRMPTRGTAGEK